MAVALSDADVAKMGGNARRQVAQNAAPTRADRRVTGRAARAERARSTTKPHAARQSARTKTVNATVTERKQQQALPVRPTGGATAGTQRAANITRSAYRMSGGGKAGFTTIRGIIWVFVWLGVLFYLVSNPNTLPRIVHIVFSPINGVLAVARGASKLP